MKTFSIISLFFLFGMAGCAQIPTQKLSPIYAKIEVHAPKVDLPHLPRPAVYTSIVEVLEISQRYTKLSSGGVHIAVECKRLQNECKHAAVLADIKYSLVRTGAESAKLSGLFDLEIGRKIIDTYDGAGSGYMARSIGDSVELIEEGRFSYPLSAELKAGEPYSVDGRLGTKVTVTLLPPR